MILANKQMHLMAHPRGSPKVIYDVLAFNLYSSKSGWRANLPSNLDSSFLNSVKRRPARKCLTSSRNHSYYFLDNYDMEDIHVDGWMRVGLRKRESWSGVSLPRSWKRRKQWKALP